MQKEENKLKEIETDFYYEFMIFSLNKWIDWIEMNDDNGINCNLTKENPLSYIHELLGV